MEVLLVMFRDGGHHRPFRVSKEQTIIGRREDCDLRIAVGDVSRKHCRLLVRGDEARIEDLGSSNGTFVNGERVQSHPLAAGDTLKVGPVAFIVQVDGVPELGEIAAGRDTTNVAKPPAPRAASRPAIAGAKPASPIDDEIDEMSILNDTGDSGAGDIDFDPDSSK